MAVEVTERLIDDLDGGAADETVSFALDGTSYEIDLSKKNAAAFRKSLDRYANAARRQGGTRSARKRQATTTKANGAKPKRQFDLVQLREWAGTNGVAVPSRGRIPQAVVEQYKAAGGR
jgi:nucleoid-associated protein Lsr2